MPVTRITCRRQKERPLRAYNKEEDGNEERVGINAHPGGGSRDDRRNAWRLWKGIIGTGRKGRGQTDGVVAFRGPVEGQRLVAADEL